VPNVDLTGLDTTGGNQNWWIWLSEQTGPLQLQRGRTHRAATKITAGGNSGTPTAYVDVSATWSSVSTTFTGNLTGQDYEISRRQAVYDPSEKTNSGAGAFLWPREYTVWQYDLNDLAAAKAHTMDYWDILPTLETFTVPYSYTHSGFGINQPGIGVLGATYDVDRRNLYVVQDYVDAANVNEGWIVLVWEVATPAPAWPPLVVPFAATAAMWAVVGLLRRKG
jgi:hypothetical protein